MDRIELTVIDLKTKNILIVMKPTASERVSSMLQKNPMRNIVTSIIVATAFVSVAPRTANAAAIAVPNFSFESQVSPSGSGNPNVDSWKKIAEPSYYGPVFGGFVPWNGTAGTYLDQSPTRYLNTEGNQGGYILAAPQVTLFQDFNSSPTHDFDATFTAGNSYNLTIGINGSSSMNPGSTLQLSLYYRDGSDNKVTVGSTTVTFSSAIFPNSLPRSLTDFSVNIPTVLSGDAWAGQKIGIQLESTVTLGLANLANWDFDNVRLSATPVPEPGSMALLALGFGGFLISRMRSRKG